MLALSLDTTKAVRDRSWNSGQTDEPRLTWRRCMEMLKPDTPAQYRDSYDGWSTKAGSV